LIHNIAVFNGINIVTRKNIAKLGAISISYSIATDKEVIARLASKMVFFRPAD